MTKHALAMRLRIGLVCTLLAPTPDLHAQAAGVDAQDGNGIVYTLDEFTVETRSEEGKVAASASLGAMRTAEKLEEIPVTVAVIPQEIMEAFQLYDPDEHAAYVASWLSGETEAGGGGGSRLRGFVPQTFRNGFARTGVGEVVNIERTEVIKGPISAMFGQSNPGGLINYVTRRARSEPSYRLSAVFGSYDYERYELHFTGPIVKDKLFYRIDGSYYDMEGVQDFWYNRTWALSGNLVYRISPATTIYLDVETLNRYMNRGDSGVLNRYDNFYNPVLDQTIKNVVGGINEELVRDGFNQYGPDVRVDREIVTYDLRVEHRFNRTFSLRVNLQYWDRTFDDWRWSAPQYYVDRGLFVGREPFRHYQPEENLSGQVDLLSSFWFGDWAENELLLTFDFTDYSYMRQDWRMELTERNKLPAEVRNLDPMDPMYGTYDRQFMTRLTSYQERSANLYGLMLREKLALIGGDLIMYASARYDRVENEAEYSSRNTGLEYPVVTPGSAAATTKDLFSGSFGGNYKLNGNKLVAFANMSSSYVPLTDIDIGTGQLQEPEKGIGYEAGLRGKLFKDSLYWTASVYQIDRYDIPQRNPDFEGIDSTPGIPQFIGAGEERSEGFELEMNGDPTPNFSFRMSFGYNDAYLTKFPDNEEVEGRKLIRAPELTASFMLIYRFRDGILNGLSTGFSGLYVDRYYTRFGGAGSYVAGTNEVTFVPEQPWENLDRIEEIRPSTMTYNLYFQRAFRIGKTRHTARVNIMNLTDKDVWTVTGRIKPGREYRFSWSVSF